MKGEKYKKSGPKPLTKSDQNKLTKIGLAISELRSASGESSESFANKNELGRTWFGRIERGDLNFKIISFLNLLETLNITPVEFFNEMEELAKRGADRKKLETRKK